MKTKPILPEIPGSWLVLGTIIVLGIVGMSVLMMLHPKVLLILFAGVFLGIAIKPAVEWLARRGIPQEVSAVLIFIIILILLELFIGYALPLLAMQTVNLTDALSQGYTNFRNSLINIPNLLISQLVRTLPDNLDLFQPALNPSAESGATSNLEGAGKVLGQVLGTGLGVVFVFFLAINWSVEGDRFLRTVLLLSSQRREMLRELFLQIENRLSR